LTAAIAKGQVFLGIFEVDVFWILFASLPLFKKYEMQM